MQLHIFGSKFCALGGLIYNLRKQFCRVPHEELTAKKWLDSIDKQKRSNLKEHRDRQTEIQTESTTKNNRLLA